MLLNRVLIFFWQPRKFLLLNHVPSGWTLESYNISFVGRKETTLVNLCYLSVYLYF